MTVVFTLILNSSVDTLPRAILARFKQQRAGAIWHESAAQIPEEAADTFFLEEEDEKELSEIVSLLGKSYGISESVKHFWVFSKRKAPIANYFLEHGLAHRVMHLSLCGENEKFANFKQTEKITQYLPLCTVTIFERDNHEEAALRTTINQIARQKRFHPNRTGVQTKRVFYTHHEFSLRDGSFPLSTVKYQKFNWIVEELLWVLRGETDVAKLQARGIPIWNNNVAPAAISALNLEVDLENDVGASYGWNLRHFGAPYPGTRARRNGALPTGGADQLAAIVNSLTHDPFSRRHIISLWDPTALKRTALPPCELFYEFYVEETEQGARELCCFALNRSSDIAVAGSWNACTAALLTIILAKTCGMIPGRLVWAAIDTHIYENNMKNTLEVLKNEPLGAPKLFFTANPKSVQDIENLSAADFQLFNYTKNYAHHPMIIN